MKIEQYYSDLVKSLMSDVLNSKMSEKLLLTESEAKEMALIFIKYLKKDSQKEFNDKMGQLLGIETELKK